MSTEKKAPEQASVKGRLTQWWGAQSAASKQKYGVGALAVVALLMIIVASGGIGFSLPGPGKRPVQAPKPVDPYVFGGGRSNIKAIEDLDRAIRRISERVDEMSSQHKDALTELNQTRKNFEDWVRSTDIERMALETRRRLEQAARKVNELEERAKTSELASEGIARLNLTETSPAPSPETAASEQGQSRERDEEPAARLPERRRPEPPTPRPKPTDGDAAPQDLFTGVGMTPQGGLGQDEAPAEPGTTQSPPPRQRTGLRINGQSISQLAAAAAERGELEESPDDVDAEQQESARPRGDMIDDNVPVGSIVSAVLLHGMDAPTGTGSRGQPVPTIARIKDLSILPNLRSMDLEDCHVLLAAYGELSSERAMGRTEDLSCTTPDGEIVHAKMQGYLVGPDGKVGVRGPVIQRNGELIVRSIQSGVLSGLGQMFGGRRQGLAISTTGRLAEQDLGEALEEGVGRGVGRAMENVSRYYLRLAESIFPVISIEAGTPVDIVITGQIEVKP